MQIFFKIMKKRKREREKIEVGCAGCMQGCLGGRRVVWCVVYIVFGAYSKNEWKWFRCKIAMSVIVEKLQHRYANNNNRFTIPVLFRSKHTLTHTPSVNDEYLIIIFPLCCAKSVLFFRHSFLHHFFIASSAERDDSFSASFNKSVLFSSFFLPLSVVYFAFVIRFRAIIIVFKQRFCWCKKILKWFLPLFVLCRCDSTKKIIYKWMNIKTWK